jgi:hypothetical protein
VQRDLLSAKSHKLRPLFLSFRHASLKQTIEQSLVLVIESWIYRRELGTQATEIDAWIERQCLPHRSPCCFHIAQLHQRPRQPKMGPRVVAIVLYCAPKPRGSIGKFVQPQFRKANPVHPPKCEVVTRRNAKRFVDVSFGLFIAPEKPLSLAYEGVRSGNIAVKSQSVLTLCDTLLYTSCKNVERSEVQMRARVLGIPRQHFG